MGETRIDKAVARIEAALSRMDAAHASALCVAREKLQKAGEKDRAGSARVMELVNRHERLREEVADSLRDLDTLIGDLED